MNAVLPTLPTNLKKSVGLIHASGTTHFFDKRVYHVLLRNAYDRLLEDDVHFIDLASLKAALQFNSHNTLALKESLNRLKRVSIEFDVLNQLKSYLYKKKSDLQLADWHSMTLLAEASIDNSIISYEFSSTMRRLLYEPDMYSVIDISLSKKFTSGYAYSLFEIGLRIKNIGTTGWMTVQDFRSIMDVPKGAYTRYRDFKRKVILVAEQEVNALYEQGLSSIKVTVLERRTRRNVTHISVEVAREEETFKPELFNLEEKHDLVCLTTGEQKKTIELLNKQYKLHIKQAGLLVEQFDRQHIANVLSKVEMARKRPGFNHRKLAGFVYAAMMGRLPGFENPEHASRQASVCPREKNNPKQQKQRTATVKERCALYFDHLSSAEKQALVAEILASKTCQVESIVELKVAGFSGTGKEHVLKHLAKAPFLNRVEAFWQSQLSKTLDHETVDQRTPD